MWWAKPGLGATWASTSNDQIVDPHTVHLVISDGVTRFHELAEVFRDQLGCTDALYLDGVISQLVDPQHPADPKTDGGYAGLLVVSVPTVPPPEAEQEEAGVGDAH